MPVLKCGCHMAAGTVYTAWMTTQYAWKMTSRWREDLKWCLPQEGRTQSRCLLVQMKALQGNSVPQIHLSPRPPAGLSLLSAETTSQVCEECLLLHIHPYMADSFIYPEERPKHRRRCINTHTPVQKGVFFVRRSCAVMVVSLFLL